MSENKLETERTFFQWLKCFLPVLVVLIVLVNRSSGQSVERQLKKISRELLTQESIKRGDPKRGALIFYTSAAGCAKCHATGDGKSPLGPDLTQPEKNAPITHLVDSLFEPSKSIRKGYETVLLQTVDGKTTSGILVREDEKEIVLRDAKNLEKEVVIDKADVEARRISKKSMMPDGLVAVLKNQREFLDLVAYLDAIAKGGADTAAKLRPSAEQMAIQDDTKNLDHAGIIRSMKKRDFNAGQNIYRGLCINCHGADGNKPSLATARAFGKEKLKFGADYYSMFMTLSKGNGLMAATTHLSPEERYQVVHFIQQKFMKDNNPGYLTISDGYLAMLPKGKERGKRKTNVKRDFGPALASQLGRDVTSALTVQLNEQVSLSYNLHTMDNAGIWKGDFLNLDATQHVRGRGEGVANPGGKTIEGLTGWRWGHEGELEYPNKGLLPRGPLPEKWMDYKGHYLHDNQAILSYSIDGRDVLELPGWSKDLQGIRRTFEIGAGESLVVRVADPRLSGDLDSRIVFPLEPQRRSELRGTANQSVAMVLAKDKNKNRKMVCASVHGDSEGMLWEFDKGQQIVLRIPKDTQKRVFRILVSSGSEESFKKHFDALAKTSKVQVNPTDLMSGGRLRWAEISKTIGFHGFEQTPYVLDTIGIPESTPWNTWFRTSALDFFPDGRMVVATHGGDIWIVSGIDEDLLNLSWKRYAAGLYEPFGVKVVDEKIYVTCKDCLTRLHDLNKDGEADFYESFSADDDVSSFFHAFNFDLQTDTQGNFYYAKAGQYTSYRLPGAIIKVSPDGKKREIFCTGFRTPNGMGILPDNRLTASDNQGNWMPASKISLLKKDGFYGYVQTHSRGDVWAPDGGRIDHTKVVPPKSFDQPIIWMPQNIDNSSGGQIWVDDKRWGPLSGRLLHTSFGKGWLFYLMIQDVGDVGQAAIVRLKHDFATGIMRGRVNPKDGQVYVTGLDGWNGGGRRGLGDKGIQRLRFTGKPYRMVKDCKVERDGLRIAFNFSIQKSSLTKAAFQIKQWNYKWQSSYGSKMYHPATGKEGTQSVVPDRIELLNDGKSVKVYLPDLKPVNQLQLNLNIQDSKGIGFEEEVYWTINRVPK